MDNPELHKERCLERGRLNQFELAKLLYQRQHDSLMASRKRVAERKRRLEEKPKEEKKMETKSTKDAVVSVSITLPTGEIKFSFTKRNVFDNAVKSRLNEREFKNCIREALKPLLGGVE